MIADALESNWIAPLGPHVDAFEAEFAAKIGTPHALALSSGTAALHLALQVLGVGRDDCVIVTTLTFIASANAVCYLGAKPVFVDSERNSWNMDPERLDLALKRLTATGRRPKAVVVVHLYGQSADLDSILELCNRYEVPLVEDAAESLGAKYRGRPTGTYGRVGVFSFNGNKIITTSGGGMLVSRDHELVERARNLSAQARDPAPHYQHSAIGYNYRLSNLLAAVGRVQLRVLDERVAARRRIFSYYQRALGKLPGLDFMPESAWGMHNRWLSTLTVRPDVFGADAEGIRTALERANIEARPVWKPLHQQPVFRDCERFGGEVAEDLFARGLCLPSGSALGTHELERVVTAIRKVHETAA